METWAAFSRDAPPRQGGRVSASALEPFCRFKNFMREETGNPARMSLMGLPAGLWSSIGWAQETSYGVKTLDHFSTICRVRILFDHLIECVVFYLLGQVLEPYSNRAIQQTNSRAYSRSTSLLGQNRRCSIAMRSLDRVESSSEIDPPGRG